MGSRPHTPVGRVDIRPHDDSTTVPQTLYYAPVSPKLEFKSTPNTPVTEKWQNLNKVMIACFNHKIYYQFVLFFFVFHY